MWPSDSYFKSLRSRNFGSSSAISWLVGVLPSFFVNSCLTIFQGLSPSLTIIGAPSSASSAATSSISASLAACSAASSSSDGVGGITTSSSVGSVSSTGSSTITSSFSLIPSSLSMSGSVTLVSSSSFEANNAIQHRLLLSQSLQ